MKRLKVCVYLLMLYTEIAIYSRKELLHRKKSILGDTGADGGGEGKSKRAEKCGTKKSKERREEPLGAMSY